MRDGASRIFGYAVLASVLLHVLVFYVLPAAREMRALLPDEAEPLIARVEPLEAPPAAREREPTPRPAAKPEARKPDPPAPMIEPIPVAAPVVAPALEPAPPAPAPAPRPAAQAAAAAPLAPQARLEVQAPAAADAGAIARFRGSILRSAGERKRYPRVAIDNAWEGAVAVRMSIAADGSISALRVTRGSGHAVLDRAALQLFESAKSRVSLPRELRGRAFDIDLEAVYDLTDQRSG